MNTPILTLYPAKLWKNFHNLTQIPRPSKKETQVVEFVKKFGLQAGLETKSDKTGNILISKPATPGFENRKTVVLQAHLDMVPQKNKNITHDFEKDPIQTTVENGWVKAVDTTLGADNGIGAAAIMAVMEADNIEHGPINALFTVDEETGMTGALAMKPGFFQGDILINTDSSDDSILYIGCASSIDTIATLPLTVEKTPEHNKPFKISVTGLSGGHSGLDIHLGRGNANKIINILISEATAKFGLRIAEINGGSLRNAIPREAFATVTLPAGQADSFVKFVIGFDQQIRQKLQNTDPNISIRCEETETPAHVFAEQSSRAMIEAVEECPDGVIAMNTDMPDIVETSTNLAIVKSEAGILKIISMQRSSNPARKTELTGKIRNVFEKHGYQTCFAGDYPGWEPNLQSPILSVMKRVYSSKFGKEPEIKVIHAGLECGILGAVCPGMDIISFGPDIRNLHSPSEKVSIASVGKFWDYLLETLKNIPEVD